MNLENLPPHGGLLVFGKSRLKTQQLNSTLKSDGIATPNFFWLKTQRITHISSGDQHALFASENGRCYGFGLNDWGQMGLEKENKNEIGKPVLIKQLKNIPIMDLACGRSHNILLTSANSSGSKQIFAFGSNTDSQLGIVGCSATATPMTVNGKSGAVFPNTVIRVVCGSDFSLALTNDGIVYAWGDNECGQLGDVSFKHEVTQPTRVKLSHATTKSKHKNLGTIINICTGYHISALMSSTGMVLVAGENYSNQFQELSTPEPARQLAISGNGQILLLSESGKIYLSAEIEDADDETGDLEKQVEKTDNYYYTNTQFNRLNVPLESDETIASISAGYSHYAFTTSKGNLFTFGEGSQGQLCNGDCSRLDSPKLVSKFGRDLFFEKVVCGGSFTVTCVRKRNDGGQPFHSGVADSVANVVPGAVVSDSGVVPPVKKPGFFDKLFGSKRKADAAKPELGPDGQPIAKKSKSCTIL